METYRFRILLADADEILDDMTHGKLLQMSDAVFEAGGDDSSPGASCGVVFVDFDREAPSLREAIVSAIRVMHLAGYKIERVEPDERYVFDEINAQLTSGSLAPT